MKVIIATKNKNKIKEISSILKWKNVQWLSLEDFPNIPPIIEDSNSFQGNAVKKAVTVALQTHCWTIADDSGLEVEYLKGEPGILSARYAGQNATDEENNKKLLEKMRDATTRNAEFCCVIAVASPKGRVQIVEGRCKGRITDRPIGNFGFGYDPLFIPEGYNETFAQMSEETKNNISHRAIALKRVELLWGEIFENELPDWPLRHK